jgi:hypothetical protein
MQMLYAPKNEAVCENITTSNMEIAKTKEKIPEEKGRPKRMGGEAGERM